MHHRDVELLQFASYGGLIFAACEIILTLKGEIKYIWTNPERFTIVRFLYLFSRYFALAAHITNSLLVTFVHHPPTHTPERICRFLLIYRAVVAFVILGVLDIILMIRVYALYNRPISMALVFAFLLAFKAVSASVVTYMEVPRQRFSPSCLVITKAQPGLYFFVVGELVLQSVIIGLTLSRHISAARGGWSTPLVSLVSRQGSMVFAAITVAMVGALVSGLKRATASNMIFPVIIIIMSTSGCRLIINMQRLAHISESEPDSVFTTMRIWSDTEISFHSVDENRTTGSGSSQISTVKFNMDSTG